MQYAASTQEEQGLEEGMREEVEHAGARAICARYTETHEHVAKLADGRERQYTLEVYLRYRNRCGKDRGDSSHPGHHLECLRSSIGKEWEGTSHHVNTSGDHGSSMDEGTDGRRAFHCRRQPHMQRYLRRFTDSTTEDQDHCSSKHRLVHASHSRRQLCKIEGACTREQDHDADNEANVTHTVGNKCFDRGAGGRETILLRLGTFIDPEADQQVRAEADQFPADEHDQEVLRKDDIEHGERK